MGHDLATCPSHRLFDGDESLRMTWVGFHKDRPMFGQPDRTETVGPPKWPFDGLGPNSVRSTVSFSPGPNENFFFHYDACIPAESLEASKEIFF